MTLSADPSPSVSGTTTPATSDHGNSNGTRTGATTPGTDLLEPLDSLDSLEAAKTVASVRVRQPREDGGVVCCFSVVEYCFKVGRVTVPPVSERQTSCFCDCRYGNHSHVVSLLPSGRACSSTLHSSSFILHPSSFSFHPHPSASIPLPSALRPPAICH
jgi:hypothetical protein